MNPVYLKYLKPALIGLGLLFLFLLSNPLVVIGAGERGVVFNSTTGIKDQVLSEGIHLRVPLVESVKSLSVRVRSTKTDLTAGSKDNQTITYKITVTYHLDPGNVNKFYQQVGDDDQKTVESLVDARAQEAVKTAAASLTADDSLTRQQETKKLAADILRPMLDSYHIVLNDVVLDDIDFTRQYNQAVEAKAEAKQEAEKAGYLKQKAQAEADATLVTASASARAIIVQAQADSEKQRLLQLSITPELLQKMAIEKWNGQYPQYVMGSSVPLIQIGK